MSDVFRKGNDVFLLYAGEEMPVFRMIAYTRGGRLVSVYLWVDSVVEQLHLSDEQMAGLVLEFPAWTNVTIEVQHEEAVELFRGLWSELPDNARDLVELL